jgi:16S rRNA (uracil1498-N3)-methyltransferase
MRRFFVSPEELSQGAVTLKGDEFHHLKNVCRLEEGERVELLDGQGRVATAVIESMTKKSADLKVEDTKTLPPMKAPHVEIVLCVPRFQKMDLIIQKCVELGATKITPVVSERSFVKTLSGDLTHKVKRWQKIASEACKQSGRAWPMEIDEATTLKEKVKQAKPQSGLFLYEGEGGVDLMTALKAWPAAPERLVLFIGAEGGFSPQEVENFKSLDLRPVTMGELVLRVETACIAILSIIQYHFGHMR